MEQEYFIDTEKIEMTAIHIVDVLVIEYWKL
jgi:hypothetical protein